MGLAAVGVDATAVKPQSITHQCGFVPPQQVPLLCYRLCVCARARVCSLACFLFRLNLIGMLMPLGFRIFRAYCEAGKARGCRNRGGTLPRRGCALGWWLLKQPRLRLSTSGEHEGVRGDWAPTIAAPISIC